MTTVKYREVTIRNRIVKMLFLSLHDTWRYLTIPDNKSSQLETTWTKVVKNARKSVDTLDKPACFLIKLATDGLFLAWLSQCFYVYRDIG